MKKYFGIALLFLCLGAMQLHAQVGMMNNNPNKDAALDLSNTTGNSKGLLMPKVTLSATNSPAPMSAHVQGMHVYNTNTSTLFNGYDVTPGEYYNDGTKWIRIGDVGDFWLLGGNTVTTSNFIGTNDATDFRIKANSTERINLLNASKTVVVGSKTSTPANANVKLFIDNGTTPGGLQISTPDAAAGAALVSDAYGNASWLTAGAANQGTGIYRANVAQTFVKGVDQILSTDRSIKITTAGSYLISIRWWGATAGGDVNSLVSARFSLYKDGVLVDRLEKYESQFASGAIISMTTDLLAKDCTVGTVLTIGINPSVGAGNWRIGSAGLSTNLMPSIIVVKL